MGSVMIIGICILIIGVAIIFGFAGGKFYEMTRKQLLQKDKINQDEDKV